MFKSARFKLTIFYLTGIMLVSLSYSFTTRWYAQREFSRSNIEQRGEFRGAVERAFGYPIFRMNDDVFGFQHAQEAAVRYRLDRYVLLINLGALIIGGFASYWFAGRTLRPIEEAHDAQKRFASDASHELRTPLAVMKTENEVFLRQKSFTEGDARELIASNLEELERLERLSGNLLALTQYENTHLALKQVSVTQIIDAAVAAVHKTDPTANIVIRVQKAKIIGDQDSLERLLAILLDNAIKYDSSGQPIELIGQKEGGGYCLTVRDHGPGITPDDLPYIFDRLYRGDKARSSQIPGHGLGLALAKRIADVNHASISASNVPEGGAVFTVRLNV